MRIRTRALRAVFWASACALSLALTGSQALAQEYPAKGIHIIVPLAAGGVFEAKRDGVLDVAAFYRLGRRSAANCGRAGVDMAP